MGRACPPQMFIGVIYMKITNTILHIKMNAAIGLLPLIAYIIYGRGVQTISMLWLTFGIALGIELYQIHLSSLSFWKYMKAKWFDTLHDLACWLIVFAELFVCKYIEALSELI
jgi:hypothetical protein